MMLPKYNMRLKNVAEGGLAGTPLESS